MQARLSPRFVHDAGAQHAADLLRACVHCGFCTATCPTYQVLGDERDSPRGRLHLVMQLLEGDAVSESTRLHLDRCLTCRACETTCPSGVQYGQIIEAGRHLALAQRPRPWLARTARRLLVATLTSPWLRMAGQLRSRWQDLLSRRFPPLPPALPSPAAGPVERVLVLQGCVQPLLAPSIDAAAERVLARLGIAWLRVPGSGCCGAIRQHTDDPEGALAEVRRNIDALWPRFEKGKTAVLNTATGCGLMLKDYGRLLAQDPAYAERAAQLAGAVVDLAELMPAQWPEPLQQALLGLPRERLVYHPPCTQQHGLKLPGRVEGLLAAAGADCLPFADRHLCCGSAGTYSLLQRNMSRTLRRRKLAALESSGPARILSANIGCLSHLASGTSTPVQHWIEWLDGRLQHGA
ncbi:MAG: hypothetical protein RL026_1586 [Pseudomonadota bacterium]|jgi:glycolate oxidase iron-sulfur subunit